MKGIPGPKALSPEWHAARRYNPENPRKFVFGATDAAPCCGMSPYRQPTDVFLRVRGMDEPQEPTDAMIDGLELEPVVLNIYERRRKVKLRRELPMYFHPEPSRWFMAATPDAIEDSDDPAWGVDAKTSTFRRIDKEGLDPLKFGIEGTDQLPIDYVLQAQQQCEVLGLQYIEFPVMFSRDYIPIYRVERNDDLIAGIIKDEREMAERIINDDPPEPNWSHEDTRSLIGLVYGIAAEKSVSLSEDAVRWWAQIQDQKDRIKHLEDCNTELTNKIYWEMQDAGAGLFPRGEKQLKKVVVKESTVAQKDVDELAARVGQTKRKGYTFLKEGKVK